MRYLCPVCNYDNLFESPYDDLGFGSYEVCPCCGFQFGYDDFPEKIEGQNKWRKRWVNAGRKWFSDIRK